MVALSIWSSRYDPVDKRLGPKFFDSLQDTKVSLV